ncbi:MAG TPA: 1-phosphofructokinase [Actinophytocola sp.]|nr:1-phosphofructokinase [Actinophytocola sp.]
MIVTVTPNPSVDRTLFVDALQLGKIMRSSRSWSEPSGKGVNVALALRAHDRQTLAVLPVGGPAGAHLVDMLNRAGLSYQPVPIAGEVRINISLIQPDGMVTKINEQGPTLTAVEGQALLDAARTRAQPGEWLAGCGSLPGGLTDDYYARIVETGHRAGANVVIDTSGPPLVQALAAGPDLIKPNTDELADAVGGTVTTVGDVLDAAQELRARGAKTVLASLGADGALLVSAAGALHGAAPVADVVSTVGAGDAMLAGYLSAPAGTREALRVALAWGAAAVQHHGTLFTAAHHQVPVLLSDSVPVHQKLS